MSTKLVIHRVEWDEDGTGRFICDGTRESECHQYPGCSCELWDREKHGQVFGEVIGHANSGHLLYADSTIQPAPGHESIPHDECWMQPWLDEDLEDLYDGDEEGCPKRNGQVTGLWQGDYLTWEYAS